MLAPRQMIGADADKAIRTTMIRPTIATIKGRSDLDCNVSILPAKRLTVPSPAVSIVGIDHDHLHHTQFLMVHHVTVKHVLAGEIEEARPGR